MSLNRRGFLKVLGVAGATLAIGKDMKGSPAPSDGVEFRAILYDATRCKGCRGCEYDCADANGLPEPPPAAEIKGLRKTDITANTVVNEYSTSKGTVYFKSQCMHCNEPACTAACLTQAMHKTKPGPVIWDSDKCMGCRYCMVSCPFDIPKFEYHSPNPKIHKCTMCWDRLKTGEAPACVYNCPNEALQYGTRRELLHEAKKRISENPGMYYDYVYGDKDAGGTGVLCLSPVPFEEVGMKTSLSKESYPSLTKGFLYSVPSVFVLVPALLLGIQQATKGNKTSKEDDHE